VHFTIFESVRCRISPKELISTASARAAVHPHHGNHSRFDILPQFLIAIHGTRYPRWSLLLAGPLRLKPNTRKHGCFRKGAQHALTLDTKRSPLVSSSGVHDTCKKWPIPVALAPRFCCRKLYQERDHDQHNLSTRQGPWPPVTRYRRFPTTAQ
jgi:hypothetical protein